MSADPDSGWGGLGGRWASSGAMALTGWPEAPLRAPDRVTQRIVELGHRVGALAAQVGEPVEVDALGLLGERAALAGLRRAGTVSCGGAARLLETADGWLAVGLAREEDWEMVPAWLGPDAGLEWDAVKAAVGRARTADLLAQGRLLGLAVAGLGEQSPPPPVSTRRLTNGPSSPAPPLHDAVVVDLSSLWAGPLCANLLQAAGARVVKVESTCRPDGGRRGSPAFFDLLHSGQEAVALDFTDSAEVTRLARLLSAADIVVEGSRPRALEQLGITPETVLSEGRTLAAGRARVWLSITGHGRKGAGRNRVGFGDDAAVAGGLVGWSDGTPCFCADAAADPLTGLVAAAAVLDAWRLDGAWFVDVAMAGVAATIAVGTPAQGGWDPADPALAAEPTARTAQGRAPALGADTESVLRELLGPRS